MKQLVKSLTLLLLVIALSYSQVYPDAERNTRVINPAGVFVNTDSISWFANPRDRQERFVFYAQNYDTLRTIITKERETNERLSKSLDFYKTASIGVAGALIGIILWEAVR